MSAKFRFRKFFLSLLIISKNVPNYYIFLLSKFATPLTLGVRANCTLCPPSDRPCPKSTDDCFSIV
jgi:hypothetical protein